MTLKTKLAAGLITTLCSSAGTYELLRTRGRGHSLQGTDVPNEEMKDDSGNAEPKPIAKPEEIREAKENADAQKSTINEANAPSKQEESVVEKKLTPDPKAIQQPHKVKTPKPQTTPKQEKEKVPKPKTAGTAKKSIPKEPSPNSSKPKLPSYKEHIKSKEKNIILVDGNTSKEDIKNILLHQLFPHYRDTLKFEKDQLFDGSPEINFKGRELKNGGKSMKILDKGSDKDVNSLKEACIKALNSEKSEGDKGDDQSNRLRVWCSVPTIKDVLERHKFKFPEKDQDWKEILDGGWIKSRAYHDKQSLFVSNTMKSLNENKDVSHKIRTLRDRCGWSMKKKFKRTNFPAPKIFWGAGKNAVADEFQEVALFCTKPITAETYVKESLNGEIRDKLGVDLMKDYCYIRRKDINYYKQIKTTDPMEGKSFWCAVRMIYQKKNTNP